MSVPRQRSLPMPKLSLHRRTNSGSSLGSFRTTSISKHYALNNQILSAFDSLYTHHKLKVAYAIGMQFIETALLEIPKHGYFYSSRHEEERLESSKNALRVAEMLQQILDDEQEEFERQAALAEKKRVERLAELAKEQRDEALSADQGYERDRATVEAELRSSAESIGSFCGSILEYGDVVTAAICPHPAPHEAATKSAVKTSTAVQPTGKRKQPSYLEPPKLEPGRSIDSYHGPEHRRLHEMPAGRTRHDSETSTDLDLERALYLSGLQVSSAPATSITPEKAASKDELDVTSLINCYREDFMMLLDSGRVRISKIDTYQGRLEGSINGCTLIAPLLCIHHFHNGLPEHNRGAPDGGLPDGAVIEVIDHETPVILPDVRGKLGLTKDALIIPSDVHDYLIERSLLSQEQFVTVCGGNLLDDKHLDGFINAIRVADEKRKGNKFYGKRIAATLYFLEHVVAIHKLRRGRNRNGEEEVWFDLIDSLPYEQTLSQSSGNLDYSERSSARSSDWSSEQREGPESDSLDPNESDNGEGSSSWYDSYIPNAARIRCLDEESLKATLKWYACSKFTDENRAYINTYAWDDMNSDFDPRVFQAFIWAEA